MIKRLISCLSALAVTAALASPVAMAQPGPGAVVRPPSTSYMGGNANGKPERHPELIKALRKLEAAKADLEHSAHDFKGHRKQALQFINQAIDQVNQALESDQR